MNFELYERKFKLIDDVLYSFYKKSQSKTKKWYLVKLSLHKDGYKRFSFNVKGKVKTFLYHRVMYYAYNNDWDLLDSSINNVIDHIDGIRTNNHISNLRNISHQENGFNRKTCKGYSFNKAIGKYQAQIRLNGKDIYIGLFDTEEEAHQAYLNKKEEIHIIQAR
jgi:outer membrane lipoprotein-sorting protein